MMKAADVDWSPGDGYGLLCRYWQGCPTVSCTEKGRLFAGWYSGGTREPSEQNYNLLVESKDGGSAWSEHPLLVIPSSPGAFLSIDIQLWVDPLNRLWVFWTQRSELLPAVHPEHLALFAIRCDSPDEEPLRWTEPFFVAPGFLRCQPTVLSDGRWLLPAYDWTCDRYAWSESSDQGMAWCRKHGGKKLRTPFDEGMFFETRDGVIHLFARSEESCIAESVSRDGGLHWTDGALTLLTAPSSRLFVRRLPTGHLLLVHNDHPQARRNLSARLSLDEGKTWPHSLLLDDSSDALSYPDAAVMENGSIFIAYDNGRTTDREIRCARITEEDIIRGAVRQCGKTQSWLRRIIAKAPAPETLPDFKRQMHRDQKWFQEFLGPGGLWGR